MLFRSVEDFEGWKSYLESEGWRWGGRFDPPHFDFVGSGTSDITSLPILSFQQLWNLNNPEDRIEVNGIYNTITETRLNQAPPDGFERGDKCTNKCGF